MNKKVRNAKHVDIDGNIIVSVAVFKKLYPNKIVFDSMLERNVYLCLKQSVAEVQIKPEKLILVPKTIMYELDFNKEQKKVLNKMLRAGKTKNEKARIKRKFTLSNEKELVNKNLLPLTCSPDFYLPEYKLYVEAKGFPNDAFPLKLKMALNLLKEKEKNIVVIKSVRNCKTLINNLKNRIL